MNAFDEIYQHRDANLKSQWLEANKHKKHYWQLWLPLDKIKQMRYKMYDPDVAEIANWMIRERTVKVREKSICFNPCAFCWDSGKSLFLKPVTVVHTVIQPPHDDLALEEKFYFEPKKIHCAAVKNLAAACSVMISTRHFQHKHKQTVGFFSRMIDLIHPLCM